MVERSIGVFKVGLLFVYFSFAVTVVLARLFLKEKLAANQWLGLALIFLGVGLVSARF